MRAVRARRADGAWIRHWLVDDGWTVCGRQVLRLRDAAIVDVEALGVEGCDVCVELAAKPARPLPNPAALYQGAGHGRVFKTGPIYRSARALRHGEWI